MEQALVCEPALGVRRAVHVALRRNGIASRLRHAHGATRPRSGVDALRALERGISAWSTQPSEPSSRSLRSTPLPDSGASGTPPRGVEPRNESRPSPGADHRLREAEMSWRPSVATTSRNSSGASMTNGRSIAASLPATHSRRSARRNARNQPAVSASPRIGDTDAKVSGMKRRTCPTSARMRTETSWRPGVGASGPSTCAAASRPSGTSKVASSTRRSLMRSRRNVRGACRSISKPVR